MKCEDPHTSHLWIKARILYTFKHRPITALYLFDCNIPPSQQERSRRSSQRGVWSRQVHHGIRRLFDCIVTRWRPAHLSQTFPRAAVLHDSLTSEDLLSVTQIFGNTN